MILRPRQKEFKKKCCHALDKYKNTLGVANTGFGKTVVLSAIVGERLNGGKALIMAHRDELTRQNSETFRKINPKVPISFFNAERKSFRGRAVFSMVQTLSQDKNIGKIPPLDMLVIDEAHHCGADTYRMVINEAKKKNPNIQILGVTATPERSDNRGLLSVFSNVADVVTINEMVRAGHLVPPVAKVIDIGTQQQLRDVSKTANDFNQAEVEAIQNTTINNNQIVSKWLELAKGRPTVVFCSTIQHCIDVRDAFRDGGVNSEAIHGQLGMGERRELLTAFDAGEIPVLCNPMILTEGWDCPRCSCIVLLRSSSHKSTMIQMIGRGLRKVAPVKYPGVVKKDCLVLDFGISLLTHGNLNANVTLKEDGAEGEGEGQKKNCPECQSELPIQTRACPLCGYEFKVELDETGLYDEEAEFRLIEIELLNKSPFKWISLFPSEKILIASGFESWAAVCSADNENWFAIGGQGSKSQVLTISNRMGAIATADDFMRDTETSRNAKKAARWMHDPASQKQLEVLARFGYCRIFSKVEAAAHLTFKFNQRKIEGLMGLV